MDIRNWPFDKIMQLPDCCFGRKFIVSCELQTTSDNTEWDISEIALPEKTVLWQIEVNFHGCTAAQNYVRLAMGDQLPTTVAQMNALEPLINGLGFQGPEPREIHGIDTGGPMRLDVKIPIAANSRRLIMEAMADAGTGNRVRTSIVVSSVPKEAPDWLISV